MSGNHLNHETVGAFVDGELSAPEREEARQHLEGCQSCAMRILSVYQLKASTKHAARGFSLPAGALARLASHAKQLPVKQPKVVPIRSMVWASVAAVLLLSVTLAGLRQSNRNVALSAELLDQHLAILSDSSSPQVISTDRHTVKPWFQGRLPFSFNLPEPTALPPETVLQGADLAYVDGKPAAQLLFSIHKHRASVFITQAGQLPEFGLHTTRAGFNLSRVRTAGLDLAAVSDINRSELDALVTVLSKTQ